MYVHVHILQVFLGFTSKEKPSTQIILQHCVQQNVIGISKEQPNNDKLPTGNGEIHTVMAMKCTSINSVPSLK